MAKLGHIGFFDIVKSPLQRGSRSGSGFQYCKYGGKLGRGILARYFTGNLP